MGDVHDSTYYAKCMVGGIFACGLTHAAVCPLDIVKCRRQVSSSETLSTRLSVPVELQNKISSNFLFVISIGKPRPLCFRWRRFQEDPRC